MKRVQLTLIAAALVLGCSSSKEAADEGDSGNDGGGDGGSTGAIDPSATGQGPSGTGGDGVDDGGESGGGFVQTPDAMGANECDPKAQDCNDGEKCTAWANDGGTFWNANKCVDITGEGVAGDSCMIEGSGVSGFDDCGLGHICMNSDMMGIGTCVAFCTGENEDCAPGSVCAIYNDGVLPICLVQCDPLLQNCPPAQACIDTPNQNFICFTDASGDASGADGDACPPEHGENSCDPGLWCGPGSNGCNDVNCCTPYCSLAAPNCPAPDECVSFYGDPGSAPPDYVDVGVCIQP